MKNLITIFFILISLNSLSQLPTDTIGYEGINTQLLDSLVEVYVNIERVDRGLEELSFKQEVKDISITHSNYMLESGNYVHSKNEYECIIGGNIWVKNTYNMWAKQIVKRWFNSSGHYKALMNPNMSIAGCGTIIFDESYGVYSFYSSFTLRYN